MNEHITVLSPEQVDGLIDKTQDAILATMLKIETLAPNLQLQKNQYLEMQKQHDAFDKELKADEGLLALLVNIKTGGNKVYKRLDNRLQKPKRKNLGWVSAAKKILIDVGNTVYRDELIRLIKANNPDFKNADATPFEYRLFNSLIKDLRMINDLRVGLADWFDKDGVIKPKYLKI